jgi:hypothetical protein
VDHWVPASDESYTLKFLKEGVPLCVIAQALPCLPGITTDASLLALPQQSGQVNRGSATMTALCVPMCVGKGFKGKKRA